jgi:hypothetical protein
MLDPQQQQDISPDAFFGSPDHIKRVAAIQGRTSVEAEVKTNRAKLETAVQKADISPDDFFGGQATSRQPSRVTSRSSKPAAWNPSGDTSPINRAPRSAVRPAATAGGDDGLAQPGTVAQTDFTSRVLASPKASRAPSFAEDATARGARVSPSTSGVSAGTGMLMAPPPGGNNMPVGVGGAPDAMQRPPAITQRELDRQMKREMRPYRNERLRQENQSGGPGATLYNAATGLAKVGAKGLGFIGRVTGNEELQDYAANAQEHAEDIRAAKGSDTFAGNVVHGGAQLAPALVVPGGPIGFGAFEASQALGEGEPLPEAIKRGVEAGVTAHLGSAAGEALTRPLARAPEAFAARVAGNVAAPVGVRAATTGQLNVTPEDIAFGAVMSIPGGRAQAARRAGILENTPKPPTRLALPSAPPEAVTAQARGPFAVSPAGEAVSTQMVARAPRLEPIPTQPLPLNRYQQRAQGSGRLETAPTSPAPSQAAQRGDFETGLEDAPKVAPITPRAETRLVDTPDDRARVAVPQASAADVGEGKVAPAPEKIVTTIKPPAPRKQSASGPPPDLIEYIRSNGGVSMGHLSGEQSRLRESRLRQPGVFNKNGMPWDDLEVQARHDGYLQDDESLESALDRSARGERIYTQDERVQMGEHEIAEKLREEAENHEDSHVAQHSITMLEGLEKHGEFAELADKIAHGEASNEELKRFAEIGRYELNVDPDALEHYIETSANPADNARRDAELDAQTRESGQRPQERGTVRDAATEAGDVDGISNASLDETTPRQTLAPREATASIPTTDNLSRVQSVFDTLKDESHTTGRRLQDIVEDRINQQALPGMESAALSSDDAILLRQMATRAPNRPPVQEQQQGLLDTAPTVESRQAQTQAREAAQSRGAANAPLFEGKSERDNIESMNRPQKPGAVEQEEGGTGKEAQPQAEEFTRPDYVGHHTAPMRDSGAPMHDLSGVYPDDIYGPNGWRYYGHGDNDMMDRGSAAVIRELRNRPNASVKIYRAVPKVESTQELIDRYEKQKRAIMARGKMPKDSEYPQMTQSQYYEWLSSKIDELKNQPQQDAPKLTINRGDWVTINREYAKEHGEAHVDGKYRIISKTVRARDIYTNGDSLHEWGYDPDEPKPSKSTQAAEVPSDAHHSNFQPRDTDSGQFVEGNPEQPAERQALIERIVQAARDQLPDIREVYELKGDNGKWYRSGGFPFGVKFNGEKRSIGFAFYDKNGVGQGRLEPTRQELADKFNASQDRSAEDFRRILTDSTDEQLQSQADYWTKDAEPPPPVVAEKPTKQAKSLGTGSPEGDARLAEYRARKKSGRSMTANQEKALAVYEEQAAADPSKWKNGDGVGWKVGVGKGGQINRGFRVVDVDADTKTAVIRQVADTGITSTGGDYDRIANRRVHIADLVRDNKYNAPHPSQTQTRDTDGTFTVDKPKVEAFHKQLLESGKSVDQYLSQPDLVQ